MYYSFEFKSGPSTTIGEPNIKTGLMSVAGDLSAFDTTIERDEFVSNGVTTSPMRGNCRIVITKKAARNLCLGMSMADYNEYLEWVESK